MHDGGDTRLSVPDQAGLRIIPVAALAAESTWLAGEASARIDAIFFASSNTKEFADAAQRQAFRERWLGRYLTHYRDEFFLAIDRRAGVIGYLAGCLDDPARQPLFADIGYFSGLSDLTARHPAHLHVNLDPAWRNRGVGARLIETFCAHAAAAGASGVHVVTGRDAPNVRFYERCGFAPLRTIAWHDARLMLLGRPLAGGRNVGARR